MKSEHHQDRERAASQGGAESPRAEPPPLDKQLTELRSQISDIGYEIDLYRSGIAASMGGGLFLLLLAGGAAYDLVTGKAGIWSPLGVTQGLLLFIAWGLGAAGAVLVIQGIVRQRRHDREREARLAELELQYSRLLDRKDLTSQGQS